MTTNTETESTMNHVGTLYLDLDAVLTHDPLRGGWGSSIQIGTQPEPEVDQDTGVRYTLASWYAPAAMMALNMAAEAAGLEVVLFEDDEHPNATATAAEIGLRYHRTISHRQEVMVGGFGDPRPHLIAADLRTHPTQLVGWLTSVPIGIGAFTHVISGGLPTLTQRDRVGQISRAANPEVSALIVATGISGLTRRNLGAIEQFPFRGGRLLAAARRDRTRTLLQAQMRALRFAARQR